MSNLPAIAEPQEVQGKSLTVEQSVDFKLSAHKAKAKELKALIANGVPTIAGIGDKAQYAKVSEWRKMAMRARTALDSDRKTITEDARKFQALVNSEAKIIAADIEAVEDALFREEDRIDKLIAEDKAAKQKVIDDRVQSRTSALLAVNGIASVRVEQLAGMPEEQFQTVLKAATVVFDEAKRKQEEEAAELARLQAEEAERKRLADEAEAKARREEAERLEAQRKAQEEAQAKIDAERAAIEAEKRAIAEAKQKAIDEAEARVAEEARKAREAEIAAKAAEKAREDAIAQAKAEAERKEREAEETRKREEAKAKAEALRLAAIEAAKPDAEKLVQFATMVRGLEIPIMTTQKGKDLERLIQTNIFNLAVLIESEANKLTK